jgi:hypothetical protein
MAEITLAVAPCCDPTTVDANAASAANTAADIRVIPTGYAVGGPRQTRRAVNLWRVPHVIVFVSVSHKARIATGYARWYAGTWKLSLVGLVLFLLCFWPLLAFQRRWTTTGPVSCAAVPSGATTCNYDVTTGTWSGTWIETANHSAVTPLGIGLTLAWLCALMLGIAGLVALGRRQYS